MINFSDITTAAEDLVQGFGEALQPTRARALEQAARRLDNLHEDIVEASQFLDNAALMLHQVADQIALEVRDLNRILPANERSRHVPVDALRSLRKGVNTFRTIFRTVGWASTGGAYVAELSLLSVSRILSTAKPVHDGIEMVRLGMVASPMMNSVMVTGRAATIARLTRCAQVFGKVAAMLGVVVNICDVILRTKAVADMRSYKAHIHGELKKLNEEIPELSKAIEELLEAMQSIYLPLADEEEGEHVVRDTHGHRLVLDTFFADIRQLPTLIELQQGQAGGEVRSLIVRLYDQSALARAAFVEASSRRQHGLAAFAAEVEALGKALRAGVTVEQARSTFTLLPETLLTDVDGIVANGQVPRLELDYLGEVTVRTA